MSTQLCCAQTFEPTEKKSTKPSNIAQITLPNNRRSESTEVDLENESQFRDVEYAGGGLIVLTGIRASNKVFKQGTSNSWSEISLQNGIHCLDFLDEKRGWAVDWNEDLWRTTDGGMNWETTGKVPTRDGSAMCEVVQFASDKKGWLVDFTELLRSSDGGKTWQDVTNVSGRPSGLVFINEKNGWVTSIDENNNSTIFTTDDEGSTWTKHEISKIPIERVFPQTASSAWLVSRRGNGLYLTHDRGVTLQKVGNLGANFVARSVFCLGPQTCFVAGYTYKEGRPKNRAAEGTPVLLKTENGGRDWSPVDVHPTDEEFFEIVKFFDSNVGILAGKNTLFETTDGGKSWTELLRLR